MKTRQVAIADLHPYPGNPRTHDLSAIRSSLRANGQYRAIVVREQGMMILAGHGTVEAADAEGWKKVLAHLVECDDDTARRIVLADNRTNDLAGYDDQALIALLQEVPDFDGSGYTPEDLQALLAGPDTSPPAPTLAERFGVPPFSVLDARQGPWRERKRRWQALGIRSEEGRPQNLLHMSETVLAAQQSGSLPSLKGKGGAIHVLTPAESRALPNRSRPQSVSDGGAEPDFFRRKTAYEKKHGVQLTNAEFMQLHEEGADTGLKVSSPNRSTPQSNSGNDPRFYEKKKLAEAAYGREFTTAEFEERRYAQGGVYTGGTSIFDPVLTELLLRWFAPRGARVLDPFAGGSVRGVVAALMGHAYVGIDLSETQVKANRLQGAELVPVKHTQPEWIMGDSGQLLRGKRPEQLREPFDFLMTCPPYADLERYSDNPADLSTMSHGEFAKQYAAILAASTKLLARDRFAAIVIGNIRRKDGSVWDLGSLTTEAMSEAGLSLYNDAILVTAIGSLALRAARIFAGGRKLARTHQQVLVYCKGAGKKADAALGKLPEGSYAVPVLADDDESS
jgi:hypothetical protein